MAASNQKHCKHFLKLSDKPLRFEPVNEVNQVFFDDTLGQVFAVRSGGTLGVVADSLDKKLCRSFRMQDKGNIICMKFNPSLTILAIQRSPKSVEFINFNEKNEPVEFSNYSQTCKNKSVMIKGFNWITTTDIAFVTDNGLELYQVVPEKQTVRSLKTHTAQVNWFCYERKHSILILSTGIMGNLLYPFVFQGTQGTKLPRIEVEVTPIKLPSLVLLDRHVSLLELYGQLYLAVLNQKLQKTEDSPITIVLYLINKDGPAKKMYILETKLPGNFALSSVDNLVVLHHPATETCVLFDIALPGDSDGFGVTHLAPIIEPLPIQPYDIQLPSKGSKYDMSTWLVFPPNIIIDARIGYLWTIIIELSALAEMITDKLKLIDILSRRRFSKNLLLEVCTDVVSPESPYPIGLIARVFDALNRNYVAHRKSIETGNSSSDPFLPFSLILDQRDLYSGVFYKVFEARKDISHKYAIAVLSEFVRSLNQYNIYIGDFILEELITRLVDGERCNEMSQLIERGVLGESKRLACLQLSLQNIYPKALHLAINMFSKENTGGPELIEIMLEKRQIISALRYVRKNGLADTISARKFLDAAVETNDPAVFHATFLFFEQRNLRLRGDPRFAPGEQCDSYVSHFEKLFGCSSALHQTSTTNN